MKKTIISARINIKIDEVKSSFSKLNKAIAIKNITRNLLEIYCFV